MLKLSFCLAAALLLGVSAARRESDLHPSLERLLSTPERWDGKRVRVRLTTSCLQVNVKEEVDVLGVFHAKELRLAPIEIQPVSRSWIPALVALWAAWIFLRRFKVGR